MNCCTARKNEVVCRRRLTVSGQKRGAQGNVVGRLRPSAEDSGDAEGRAKRGRPGEDREEGKASIRARGRHPFNVIKASSGWCEGALPRLGEKHRAHCHAVDGPNLVAGREESYWR